MPGPFTLTTACLADGNPGPGEATKLPAKVLVIAVSPCDPGHYLPLMNIFFSAQKSEVPLDVCTVGAPGGEASAVFQQGTALTGGVQMQTAEPDSLLQLLLVSPPSLHLNPHPHQPRRPSAHADAQTSCVRNHTQMRAPRLAHFAELSPQWQSWWTYSCLSPSPVHDTSATHSTLFFATLLAAALTVGFVSLLLLACSLSSSRPAKPGRNWCHHRRPSSTTGPLVCATHSRSPLVTSAPFAFRVGLLPSVKLPADSRLI